MEESDVIFVLRVFVDLKQIIEQIMGITKPCTQLHPAPSTPTSSFQPPSSSIYPYPTHFNLQPALCNTLNVIRTKISHVIGWFPQI